MKILVIEDDITTGTYIARVLREEGHVVDLVANGREGLVAATGGGHDVLIVDRMLPQVDGQFAGKCAASHGGGGSDKCGPWGNGAWREADCG